MADTVDLPTYEVHMLVETLDPAGDLDSDNIWTGEGNLTIADPDDPTVMRTYHGNLGGAVRVDAVAAEIGAPVERLDVAFDITDPLIAATTLEDPGPLQVTLRWIYRPADVNGPWQYLNRRAVGNLSAPRISEGQYIVTIEFESGRDDRLEPVKWSHEDSRKRDTGDTTFGGMAYIADLAAGITVNWPPGQVLENFYSGNR